MERNEILKSLGFSERFLQALDDFDKAVPNVYYKIPFRENVFKINLPDTTGDITINWTNKNYNQDIIIRQY